MSAKTNLLAAFMTVLVFTLPVLAADAAKEVPPDPFADSYVFVEAFVVQVSTEGLKSVGVDPIGQSPDGISISKLTKCLEKDKTAKVITGFKVSAKNNSEAASKEDSTIFIKEVIKSAVPSRDGKPGEIQNVQYRDYRTGKGFNARCKILSGENISVEYRYDIMGIDTSRNKAEEESGAPADTYTYNWEGDILLRPGRPAIAAAVQNETSVVFFVLTATIHQTPPAEQEQKDNSVPKAKP